METKNNHFNNDPYDFENYYEGLKDFTFETRYVALNAIVGQAIVDQYEDTKFGSKKLTEEGKTLLIKVPLDQRVIN